MDQQQHITRMKETFLAHREAQLALQNRPYVRDKTILAVRELCLLGINGARLDALLDLVMKGTSGDPMATKHYLEAIVETEGKENLKCIAKTGLAYQSFLDELNGAIQVRENLKNLGYGLTFNQAFRLYRQVGEISVEIISEVDHKLKEKDIRLSHYSIAKIVCDIAKTAEKDGRIIEVAIDEYMIKRGLGSSMLYKLLGEEDG